MIPFPLVAPDIHRGKQTFDTGLNLSLLQEYIFVPLDVFRKKLHNKAIETELEAWLGFLAFDDLKRIWEISRFDPIFREMYHDLSEYRKDVTEVLGVFSEILYEMDVEAAKYQSSQEKKKLRKELSQQKRALSQQAQVIENLAMEKQQMASEIQRLHQLLAAAGISADAGSAHAAGK